MTRNQLYYNRNIINKYVNIFGLLQWFIMLKLLDYYEMVLYGEDLITFVASENIEQ